jgi:hypothetical protein
MSTRSSISGSAAACSGAVYPGVPTTTPVAVIGPLVRASLIALAMPKSATSAPPSDINTFSGLMSR